MLYQVDLILISPAVALEPERESSRSDLTKLVSLVVNRVLMIMEVEYYRGWRHRMEVVKIA